MTNIATFIGFPTEGVQFLRDLAENNNKTWFEENKQRYKKHVQAPTIALVAALGEQLQAEFPAISYDTRTTGN